MIIHCYGGLANRLRVLLSYAADGYTQFRWDPNGEIANATFASVFEPIPGIQFVNGAVHEFRTCDPLPTAPASWRHGYRLLRLRETLFKPPAPYGAIHVRRTDHVEYARELRNETPDSEFFAWLEKAPRNVYLATDNGTTQQQYASKILSTGREVYMYMAIEEQPRQNEGGVRNTSLAHAAADLFACAGASAFKGTRESSFSDTIDMLRDLKGWWT